MKYRWGFDIWGLGLFLLMMVPTVVWSMVPAPNDVLRTESVTPVVDTIASTLQFPAFDRKNLPAAVPAAGFAICHLIFALVNFLL